MEQGEGQSVQGLDVGKDPRPGRKGGNAPSEHLGSNCTLIALLVPILLISHGPMRTKATTSANTYFYSEAC